MFDNIIINPEWLRHCKEYCQSKQLNEYDMSMEMYKNFIHSDLQASLLKPKLPENSTTLTTQRIEKIYLLQIVDIVEIGISSQNVLQEIEEIIQERKTNPEKRINLKKNMLKLTLSDGQRIIYAVENSPISYFHLDMKLGAKMYIKNAEAVRGVLLLNPNNVEFLGGYIPNLTTDDILIYLQAKLKDILKNGNKKKNMKTIRTITFNADNNTKKNTMDSNKKTTTTRKKKTTINNK
ncbi:hypothetical protein BCR32DRAFT_264978 [Anaeromyces robustus]|uniref:RecQ-mediated genome instability protein 1 n=1 Tax=Anaeromyces robustus TaxID=1754192 RepID=A0A1Y1XL74_9FUNG|nr:hypothetical protein BCR32DRAFT_264978 [Anaeromyces robustus]|eukprot:ORX86443.1 hypothetical protein BCR32DRAFT_264978 [Anaeromyces robustus]